MYPAKLGSHHQSSHTCSVSLQLLFNPPCLSSLPGASAIPDASVIRGLKIRISGGLHNGHYIHMNRNASQIGAVSNAWCNTQCLIQNAWRLSYLSRSRFIFLKLPCFAYLSHDLHWFGHLDRMYCIPSIFLSPCIPSYIGQSLPILPHCFFIVGLHPSPNHPCSSQEPAQSQLQVPREVCKLECARGFTRCSIKMDL